MLHVQDMKVIEDRGNLSSSEPAASYDFTTQRARSKGGAEMKNVSTSKNTDTGMLVGVFVCVYLLSVCFLMKMVITWCFRSLPSSVSVHECVNVYVCVCVTINARGVYDTHTYKR